MLLRLAGHKETDIANVRRASLPLFSNDRAASPKAMVRIYLQNAFPRAKSIGYHLTLRQDLA